MTSLDKPTAAEWGDREDQDVRSDQPEGADEAGGSVQPEESSSQAATEAALFEAFGGVRGLVETTLPGLIFIGIYTVNKDIHTGAVAALILSGVLGIARLVRRDTVKHAFSGVFGVAVGVAFAMVTGNAKDFYLPGMLYGLGLSLAYILSAALGFPLLGLILGPVFKENLSWRTRNPGRKTAYVKASYAWGLIFLTKSAILFPLYFWGDTTRFGWVTMALKIPPILLAVYLTWIFLAKAPPPINVIAEMEAEIEAEEAAEAAEREAKERAARDPLAAAADGRAADDAVGRPSDSKGRHRR